MNIAVIGTNFITDRFLLGAAHNPAFTLAAVCGSSAEKAAAFGAQYGNPPAFGDYREVARLPGLDGVYIASPNQLHHPMTMFFLEAGIPVLCEKPLAPTLRQADEMIALSRKKNVPLVEAIVPLFTPNFGQLRDTLPEIGTVRGATLSFCQYSSRYDSYHAGVIQNAFRRECMGGSLLDIGIYPLYHAMALLGEPDRVLADATLLSTGVDGCGTALLCYPGKQVTILHSKVNNTESKNELRGENGSILYNAGSNPLELLLFPRQGAPRDITLPQLEDRMYYELTEFLRCISTGAVESPLAPHALGLAVYRVTDEIRRQTGVKFEID